MTKNLYKLQKEIRTVLSRFTYMKKIYLEIARRERGNVYKVAKALISVVPSISNANLQCYMHADEKLFRPGQ